MFAFEWSTPNKWKQNFKIYWFATHTSRLFFPFFAHNLKVNWLESNNDIIWIHGILFMLLIMWRDEKYAFEHIFPSLEISELCRGRTKRIIMINGTQSELNFSNKRFTIAFLLAVLLSFEIISHANLTWDDKMMLRSANLAYFVSFFCKRV